MRSLLTTLGIVIGVGSVVLMVSIGGSFEQYILSQVESFSGDTFEINAKGLEQMGQDMYTITFGDLEAIRTLTTVQSVAPVIFVQERTMYGREELDSVVFGSTKEIFNNWSLQVQAGRLLTDDDVNGARSVTVLGPRAAEELFGEQDPLGSRIRIGTQKFTVVGVLQELGSPLAQTMDAFIYMPFTVAKSMMGRTQYVDYISLQSKGGDNELTRQDITALLRQRHRIDNPTDDPDKDDFIVRSFEQATAIISTVTMGITIFLGLVAGISLLVGGIGIMNIMLVSVSERTKEIGLRKAVGARRADILRQFLLEAVALTLVGGFVGLLLGVAAGYFLALVAAQLLGEFTFALSWSAVIMAVAMAAGTGLAFGIYPAKKAADLSPMEAMRWE